MGAWDKLGDEFANSKTALIGDVDCTVHKDLCSRFGVRGYPTIKYFTSNPEGEDYQGGRDYDSLLSFAKENLGPSCSWPDNKDLCDEEQPALSAEDRQAEIDEIEGKIKDLKDGFETFLEGLQNQYEEAKKKMEDDVKELQPDLRLLKVIKSDDAKEEL